MNNLLAIVLLNIIIVSVIGQNTPVIGGSCKTGTPDVQIGAKQTQFFLKCEANDDSQDGNGIWVVKSRAAAAPTSNENQNAQQHPSKMRKIQMSNVCEQDSSARESQACTTSETCLQQNYEQAGSYLQCDTSSQRWVKRSCQQDFVFSFEHQSCIGHTKTIRHVARQAASGGVICTYTQCNNNSPCNIGTCNNGYCCSSAPIAPIQGKEKLTKKKSPNEILNDTLADFPVGPPGFGLPSEISTLDRVLIKASGNGLGCAAGFSSPIKCTASRECPPGLFCDIAVDLCCPLLLPLTDITNPNKQRSEVKRRPITITQSCPSCNRGPQIIQIPANNCNQNCPRGYVSCCTTQASSCCLKQQCSSNQVSTGRRCFSTCLTGEVCVSGVCCSQQSSCPGGGMPYGTCNSGYCSAGYQCIQSTNMCCASSIRQISTCPGNRIAVGNCMNGRCGSGYSCNTQSNSCCPDPTICPDGTQAAGACVNNQCGTGFTCTSNLCCSSASTTPRCLDGSSAVGACISGRCGSGFTCTTGNICCPSTLTVCPVGQVSIGRCVNGICPNGYTCVGNSPNDNCCGAANTITCDAADASGPCIAGACPDGFLCDNDATNPQCCPNVDFTESIGPCIADACPAGYLCVQSQDQCFLRLDGGTGTGSIGPCIAGQCPTGFTCDTTTNECLPTAG